MQAIFKLTSIYMQQITFAVATLSRAHVRYDQFPEKLSLWNGKEEGKGNQIAISIKSPYPTVIKALNCFRLIEVNTILGAMEIEWKLLFKSSPITPILETRGYFPSLQD